MDAPRRNALPATLHTYKKVHQHTRRNVQVWMRACVLSGMHAKNRNKSCTDLSQETEQSSAGAAAGAGAVAAVQALRQIGPAAAAAESLTSKLFRGAAAFSSVWCCVSAAANSHPRPTRPTCPACPWRPSRGRQQSCWDCSSLPQELLLLLLLYCLMMRSSVCCKKGKYFTNTHAHTHE